MPRQPDQRTLYLPDDTWEGLRIIAEKLCTTRPKVVILMTRAVMAAENRTLDKVMQDVIDEVVKGVRRKYLKP